MSAVTENAGSKHSAAMKTPPDRVAAGLGGRAQATACEGEGAYPRPRRAGGRAPAHAVDAGEQKLCLRGAEGQGEPADLFEGRRQLIVYRAFFEPGVFGWPEHACRGCSMVADQVAHVAHLNARDTTLAFVSRAPQADIARLKARMGWELPWYTITDSFDADFGVDEWHGTNVFFRDGDRLFRTYFINNRGDEADGRHLELSRHHAARPPGGLGGFAEGYPQTPTYKWWNWHDNYAAEAEPDQRWVEISDAGPQ